MRRAVLRFKRQCVVAAFTSFKFEGMVFLRSLNMGSDIIVEFRRTKEKKQPVPAQMGTAECSH